jgi:hypothetical protein
LGDLGKKWVVVDLLVELIVFLANFADRVNGLAWVFRVEKKGNVLEKPQNSSGLIVSI